MKDLKTSMGSRNQGASKPQTLPLYLQVNLGFCPPKFPLELLGQSTQT